MYPVLVNSLKWLEVQDALNFLQPIENVLLQRVEAQISGQYKFALFHPCQVRLVSMPIKNIMI